MEGVLKSCMWKFSAGVNRRLPLVVAKGEGHNDDESFLISLWKDLIMPRAKAFAERYVMDRLG